MNVKQDLLVSLDQDLIIDWVDNTSEQLKKKLLF